MGRWVVGKPVRSQSRATGIFASLLEDDWAESQSNAEKSLDLGLRYYSLYIHSYTHVLYSEIYSSTVLYGPEIQYRRETFIA